MTAENIQTHFASPERAAPGDIDRQLSALTADPVVEELLRAMSGLVAVLNPQRQVLVCNLGLLEFLGIADPQAALGLRLGEAAGCRYSHEGPAGCGTGPACRSCGAAIAMVAALADEPVREQICVLSAQREMKPVDLCLRVRCSRLARGGQDFLLLFLNDITRLQQLETLQRSFMHDVNNLLGGLLGAIDLLPSAPAAIEGRLLQSVGELGNQLAAEIQLQRLLLHCDRSVLATRIQPVALSAVVADLSARFREHPVAQGRRLLWPERGRELVVPTDRVLLGRAVANLVINALEATAAGGEVRVELIEEQDGVGLAVCNAVVLAPEVAARIFQRNFSTKEGQGRGLGTYATRFLVAQFLGGRVTFTSNPAGGTRFAVTLPR